jgi:hypothetical protein
MVVPTKAKDSRTHKIFIDLMETRVVVYPSSKSPRLKTSFLTLVALGSSAVLAGLHTTRDTSTPPNTPRPFTEGVWVSSGSVLLLYLPSLLK